jgi:hypothetical protein
MANGASMHKGRFAHWRWSGPALQGSLYAMSPVRYRFLFSVLKASVWIVQTQRDCTMGGQFLQPACTMVVSDQILQSGSWLY